ncbi:hypothetical protein QP363_11040 [Corynebacterium sp. UMB6689]|uniref:hypothetical protein n=1 Tax=Corynebacterium sp. UMB6689 TaxID=3046341 RepID=UPI00254E1744|nr:hypothetical protein [Corynebacterium sp. UMB6689]MDK6814524.1 hypothetical protein [Corynebacterium sp. UMB6689]
MNHVETAEITDFVFANIPNTNTRAADEFRTALEAFLDSYVKTDHRSNAGNLNATAEFLRNLARGAQEAAEVAEEITAGIYS